MGGRYVCECVDGESVWESKLKKKKKKEEEWKILAEVEAGGMDRQ